MASISPLPAPSAIPSWNRFASTLPFPAPFSFNPSLFAFYQKHFRWKPYYFIAYQRDEIAGLFPVVFTGRAMVSLPHFSYGGVLEKEKGLLNKADLLKRVFSFIGQKNVSSGFFRIDLSETGSLSEEKAGNFLIRSLGDPHDSHFVQSAKVTFWMALKDEKVLYNSLGSNLRRKINKASRMGFELKTGGAELLPDFYAVYRKNIARLRSLPYGTRFFNDLFATWRYGDLKFFVVYYQSRPAGAALLASYNGFYENVFFATLQEVQPFYISDWLHWQMVKYVFSTAEKLSSDGKNPVYSFGRSTENSSVHTYKAHWPVTLEPLYVYSNLMDIKRSLFLRKIWGALPASVALNLGPKIIKHIY